MGEDVGGERETMFITSRDTTLSGEDNEECGPYHNISKRRFSLVEKEREKEGGVGRERHLRNRLVRLYDTEGTYRVKGKQCGAGGKLTV